MRHVRPLLFVFAFSIVAGSAFAGLSVSPGTPAHTHSDANTGGGTLAVSGTVSSTKACFSGYTRISPNFCQKNAATNVFNLSAAGCTLSTAPGPTDVKALLLTVTQDIVSANVVGLRDATLNIYAATDTACAGGGQFTPAVFAREQVAVTAGTQIATHYYQVKVQTSSTGVFPVQWVSGGIVTGAVAGYFD